MLSHGGLQWHHNSMHLTERPNLVNCINHVSQWLPLLTTCDSAFLFSLVNTLGTIFVHSFFIAKFWVRILCVDDFSKPSSPAIMRTAFFQSSLTAANTRATFSSVRAVEGRPSRGSSLQLFCPSLKRFTHLQTVEFFIALCLYTCLNMVSIVWASLPSFVKNLTFVHCSIASFVSRHRGCSHATQHDFTQQLRTITKSLLLLNIFFVAHCVSYFISALSPRVSVAIFCG